MWRYLGQVLSSASESQSLTNFLQIFVFPIYFLALVYFLTTFLIAKLWNLHLVSCSHSIFPTYRLRKGISILAHIHHHSTKEFLPNLFQRPRHLFTMAGPDYGALGATFKVVRMLQVISLLGCIGMAANFISEMVNQNDAPSKELVGTLSVVGIDLPTSFSPRLIPFLRPASRFSIAQSPSSFTSTTSFLTCSTPVWTACCSLPSLSSPSSSGDLYRT